MTMTYGIGYLFKRQAGGFLFKPGSRQLSIEK